MSICLKSIKSAGLLAVCFLLLPDLVVAKQRTRNITVRVNKTEVVWTHFILNARFEKEMEKCQAYRPPTIVLRRKPKIGKVIIKNGVKFDSDKNSPCKGKKVLGSIVEFRSDKRGKTTFKIDILQRSGTHYDHKYGDVTINVTVR